MWGYGPYGMMGYGGGWGPMMLFGGFFWIILLTLGVVAVMWVVRASSHGARYTPRTESSSSGLSILEERYARGEINRDEYLQKEQDILERGGPTAQSQPEGHAP